jgi:molybdenum cofactor cytidylyltransferase
MSGDQGAAAYLRSRRDVEMVDCGDLASGRDIDRRQGEPGLEV